MYVLYTASCRTTSAMVVQQKINNFYSFKWVIFCFVFVFPIFPFPLSLTELNFSPLTSITLQWKMCVIAAVTKQGWFCCWTEESNSYSQTTDNTFPSEWLGKISKARRLCTFPLWLCQHWQHTGNVSSMCNLGLLLMLFIRTDVWILVTSITELMGRNCPIWDPRL